MTELSPTPVPARITAALDVRGLYGPEVDLACGASEPDVDRWEDPRDPLLPDARQVALLAELTGYPVGFFYQPMTPVTSGFICYRRGPKPRCRPLAPQPGPTHTQSSLF